MTRSIRFFLLAVALITANLLAQPGDLVATNGSQFLTVPSDPALMPLNGLTVEAWIYYDDTLPWGGSYPTVVRKSNGGHPYILRISSSSKKLQFGIGTATGGYTGFDSSVTITPLVWTHVAATWDGTIMNYYKDGVPAGSFPKSGVMSGNTQDLWIGGGPSSVETWKGRIDEIRIWDHARSQTEINTAMFVELDNAPGLVSAWHFNGNFNDSTSGFNAVPQGGIVPTGSTSPVKSIGVLAPATAPIGSPIQFLMRGGAANAPYFFDNSFAGATTGMPLVAPLVGSFPLNPPLLNLTYGASAPGIFDGYMGFMDAQGTATATFHIPAFPNLMGLTLYSAFLYLDNLLPMVLGEVSHVSTTVIVGPEPVINTVAPNSGPLAGGSALAITGQYFAPGATVQIGGLTAPNVSLVNAGLILCQSPAGAFLGSATVKVTNLDGAIATAVNAYTYVEVLQLTTVAPINAGPGSVVTLTGSGFQASAQVTVGGQVVTPTSQTPTQIQFTMPANVPCHSSVVVTNPNGQTAGLVMTTAPFVSLSVGVMGPYSGGTTCQIFGGNFSTAAQVTFDGVAATIVTATANFLEVLSPPGLIGPAIVLIQNPDGCSTTSSFYYHY